MDNFSVIIWSHYPWPFQSHAPTSGNSVPVRLIMHSWT